MKLVDVLKHAYFVGEGVEYLLREAIDQGYEQCGVYDYFGGAGELSVYVAERSPQRIGVNMAAAIGGADYGFNLVFVFVSEYLRK